jgi:hypothetical protein
MTMVSPLNVLIIGQLEQISLFYVKHAVIEAVLKVCLRVEDRHLWWVAAFSDQVLTLDLADVRVQVPEVVLYQAVICVETDHIVVLRQIRHLPASPKVLLDLSGYRVLSFAWSVFALHYSCNINC